MRRLKISDAIAVGSHHRRRKWLGQDFCNALADGKKRAGRYKQLEAHTP
jgi:hypothetical protein